MKKAGRHWRYDIKGYVGGYAGETTEESRRVAKMIPFDSDVIPGFLVSWSVPRGFHLGGGILPTLRSIT